MAETPAVHIGENSPEEVALKLFHIMFSREKAVGGSNANASGDKLKKWVLDNYAECLMAVRQPEDRLVMYSGDRTFTD